MTSTIGRTFAISWTLAIMVGIAIAAPPTAPAANSPGTASTNQPLSPSHTQETVKATLDLRAFLTSPDALTDTIDGPVWQVKAGPGRQLVQLPIIMQPAKKAVDLSRPPIELRGGPFLAWRITTTTADRSPGQMRFPSPYAPENDMRGPDAPPNMQALQGMLRQGRFPGQAPPQIAPPPSPQPSTSAGPNDALPPNAPLLTRRLTVHPDATITWLLDRSIPEGTVKPGNAGYALKLRPDRLRALEPGQVTAPNRAANTPAQRRQMIEQQRQAQAQLRQQQQDFMRLRRHILELPDHFAAPLPEPMWAVFEMAQGYPELRITGPAPLPWTINFSDLKLLRDTAAHANANPADPQTNLAIDRMLTLAHQGNPLMLRAIAITLDAAKLVDKAAPNDTLYRLVQTLLRGPDPLARKIMTLNLAQTPSPSAASVSLLREAAKIGGADLQLVALGGLLKSDLSTPASQRASLSNINHLLADPKGPDAAQVLQVVVNSLSDNPRQPSQTLSPQAAAFVRGIDFQAMPPDRRDHAIAYVIHAAGTHPLAGAWLNHALLTSAHPDLAQRTYELLGQVNHASQGPVQRATQKLMALVFSRPTQPQPVTTPTSPTAEVSLSAPIPLTSTHGGLFLGIHSGDPAIRTLAWKALPNFVIPQNAARSATPDQPNDDPYAMLMTAALDHHPTPVQIVDFIAGQPDQQRATQALATLTAKADPQAAEQAARALFGSRLPLDRVFQVLPPAMQAQFAHNLYQAVIGHAGTASGLLGDAPTGQRLAQWFARQVAAGTLPTPADWANQVNNEPSLIQLIASKNTNIAHAAVAALVGQAGGDTQMAHTLAQHFDSMKDRSLATLTKTWNEAKREIYARRLTDIEGDYRLIVNEFAPSTGPPMPPIPDMRGMSRVPSPTTAATTTVRVGIVNLTVEDQTVYLANKTLKLSVPTDHFALRLDQAASLKNLNNQELSKLPLQHVTPPIDLTRQHDGSWAGQASLPDGTTFQVILQPVN